MFPSVFFSSWCMCVCVCVCVCVFGRPDMTFAVDWALSNNYLSIYLVSSGFGMDGYTTHVSRYNVCV